MSSSNPTEPAHRAADDQAAKHDPRATTAVGPRGRRGAARLIRQISEFAFSTDPRLEPQTRSACGFAFIHLTWAIIYWATARHKTLGVDAMHLMVATNLVGILGFYPCLRLGWTRQLRDSGLAQSQMLWSSFSAALGFALAPSLRPALLQALCIIQIYGFFHLRPRQLVLTGGGAVSMLVTALALGAAGHLPRFDVGAELYPALLTVSVLIGITWITIDHSARRERTQKQKLELNAAVAAVRDLVIRDTLTGLFNRRHMQELLLEERSRALATGRQFAVALVDLDHFKRINDAHGHSVGDDVLRGFADMALLSMRTSDAVARWGGEEFLVLMPETGTSEEAQAPLDRLREAIERQDAGSLLRRLGLTFSAGIAFHRVSEPVDQVVAGADRALYAAKAAGRNRLRVDTDTLAGAASPVT